MIEKILRFAMRCCEFLCMLNNGGSRLRAPISDELLLERYGQLEEKQSMHNEIIHRTFYISIVFWGILIGGWTRLSLILQKSILFLFAFIVFLTMLCWTWSYLNGRSAIKDEKSELRRQINTSRGEVGFTFSSDKNGSKIQFLTLNRHILYKTYYTVSAIVCLLISVALFEMYQPGL